MATATKTSTSSAAQQVAGKLRDVQAGAEDSVGEAMRIGAEAAQDARDAVNDRDTTVRAAIRERPYTAIALAGFAGFLYAVTRR